MNVRSIQKACVMFLLLVSVLTPSKIGLGQGFSGWRTIDGLGTEPKAVVVDKSGLLYVSDGGTVYTVNKDGSITILAERGPILGDIFFANGLALDLNDNLWMADILNHQIVKRDGAGKYGFLGGLGDSPGMFRDPAAVTFDSTGQLWVVD